MLLVLRVLEMVTLLQVPDDDTHETSYHYSLRAKMVSVLKSSFQLLRPLNKAIHFIKLIPVTTPPCALPLLSSVFVSSGYPDFKYASVKS